ncbi:MAG: hypothetical protein HN472_02200 [Nitrospina sp.]|jgi:hypothetical protein|nr:hypothetical protein [Nitrospina sp.]MBT3874718.1 hypothetical protein [Nitrospina sp.]MBT4049452.1 hypothetical protein [Nitrospina sp.]MBT4558386.1 hypothetical protein [Nitrospina sp.]MBT5348923.1 hypothetical protein [Nitrospina sp.]
MTWERDKKKRLAEYLWTEINKAILKSPDVQFSIKKLQKLQLLDYVSEFNLVLEVDKLIESILKQNEDREASTQDLNKLKEEFLEAKANSDPEELQLQTDPEESETLNLSPSVTPDPLQWVDGKALSENEIRFEEFFNQQFDEKHWMKKAKIRFDS